MRKAQERALKGIENAKLASKCAQAVFDEAVAKAERRRLATIEKLARANARLAQTRVWDQRLAEIAQAVASGTSVSAIAKAYGISYPRASQLVQRAQREIRRENTTGWTKFGPCGGGNGQGPDAQVTFRNDVELGSWNDPKPATNHGDAISSLMKAEGLTFPEAVERLAKS